jgi:hypothetical protein
MGWPRFPTKRVSADSRQNELVARIAPASSRLPPLGRSKACLSDTETCRLGETSLLESLDVTDRLQNRSSATLGKMTRSCRSLQHQATYHRSADRRSASPRQTCAVSERRRYGMQKRLATASHLKGAIQNKGIRNTVPLPHMPPCPPLLRFAFSLVHPSHTLVAATSAPPNCQIHPCLPYAPKRSHTLITPRLTSASRNEATTRAHPIPS